MESLLHAKLQPYQCWTKLQNRPFSNLEVLCTAHIAAGLQPAARLQPWNTGIKFYQNC